MKHVFTTEVEFEDESGGIEVREVTAGMISAQAVGLAEREYTVGNLSHEQAVEAAMRRIEIDSRMGRI